MGAQLRQSADPRGCRRPWVRVGVPEPIEGPGAQAGAAVMEPRAREVQCLRQHPHARVFPGRDRQRQRQQRVCGRVACLGRAGTRSACWRGACGLFVNISGEGQMHVGMSWGLVSIRSVGKGSKMGDSRCLVASFVKSAVNLVQSRTMGNERELQFQSPVPVPVPGRLSPPQQPAVAFQAPSSALGADHPQNWRGTVAVQAPDGPQTAPTSHSNPPPDSTCTRFQRQATVLGPDETHWKRLVYPSSGVSRPRSG